MSQKSPVAAAAAAIKQELKAIGVKASVRSSRYSGGNSVYVTVYNQPAAQLKQIDAICKKYKAGHFDGMTDSYEFNHIDDGLPKAMYVSIDHERSDAFNQTLLDKVNARYGLNVSLDDYKNGARIEYNSHYACNSINEEIYRLSTGAIDYDADDARHAREREILAELQSQHGFAYFTKPGSNVRMYLRDQSWSLNTSWQLTSSLADDYSRPAAEIATELAALFDTLDAEDKVASARDAAEQAILNQDITPLAVSTETKAITVVFPALNKNCTTTENDTAILVNHYKETCEIKKTVIVNAEHFAIISRSLLHNRDLWEKIGGREVDDQYLQGIKENSKAYLEAFNQFGTTLVVEVVNHADGDTLYINTEGNTYARYVGRSTEWLAKRTADNIIANLLTPITAH